MTKARALEDRYVVDRVLAERRGTATLLAHERATARRCIVKRLSVAAAYRPRQSTLSFSGPDGDKAVELFERETRVLARLQHPGIPRLIDSFTRRSDADIELYLVEEAVDGLNLAEHLRAGRLFTEGEIVDIGARIAAILAYLHGFVPPVIHRDIKPSNVILSEDGSVYLIDFGAVQMGVVPDDLGGSTIVGSSGYMPLEQFEGRACAASDVYATGVTLIELLARLGPRDLDRDGLRPTLPSGLAVAPGLRRVIERATDADASRRYHDGAQLLAALRGNDRPAGPKDTPEPPAPSWWRPKPRRLPRWHTPAIGIAAVAAMVLMVWAGVRVTPSGRPQAPSRPPPAPPAPPSPQPAPPPAAAYWHPLDVAGEPLAIQAVDGVVWVATSAKVLQDGVERLPGAAAEKFPTYLNLTIRAMGAASANEVWAVGSYGAVLRWTTDGAIVGMLGGIPEPTLPTKTAIAAVGDEVYALVGDRVLAAKVGSVRVDFRAMDLAWQRVTGAPARPRWLAVVHGALAVAADDGLWRRTDGRWTRFVAAPGPVAIAGDRLATEDGLVTLGANGQVIERALSGQRLTAVATAAGRVWVGTAEGLLLRAAPGRPWQRLGSTDGLPGSGVVALAERDGQLVVGFAGAGVYSARVEDIGAAVAATAARPSGPGQVFDDAGAAAETLLADATRSGGVAWERRTGRPVVYFDGRRVFPAGHGAMNAEGASVALANDWSGTLRTPDGTETPIAPPTPAPDGPPGPVLLDPSGRVVVGSASQGVLRRAGGAWTKDGDVDLHGMVSVACLAFGDAGFVWAGTASRYESFPTRAKLPQLHVTWDGPSDHFDVGDDEAVTAVLVFGKRLAVGTPHGLFLADAFAPSAGTRRRLEDGDKTALKILGLRARRYASAEGLRFAYVDSLSADARGRLWIGHGTWGDGITFYDGAFHNVSAAQGLFANRIAASAHDGAGRVWLLAADGRVGVYLADELVAAGAR
jgi:serine/threonine protein kinase